MIGKYQVIGLLAILSLSMTSAYADQSIIDNNYSPEELYDLGLDYEVLNQTDKSFIYFDKAAQMNYLPAMLKMVNIHRQEGRTREAKELLEKAVRTGDAVAIYEKAREICDKQPTVGNRECIKLLSISANKGYAIAYRRLANFRISPKESYNDYLMAYSIDGIAGEIFSYGEKAGYDLERIVSDIEKIQKAAGKGETEIAESLGRLLRDYASGFSGKIVNLRALNLSSKYFQIAIEKDSSRKDIYSDLAEDAAYGFGGKQNWNKAFEYMKLAAKADPGTYNIDEARMHYFGLGTEQDINETLKLAQASDYLGFFGSIYAKGSGVPQDFEKYVNLQLEQYAIFTLNDYKNYSDFGKRKHQAIARLGEPNSSEKFYSQGVLLVLENNYEEALKYLIIAAEQGHDKAIEFTASLFARGLGCEKNYKTSFEWLEKIKKKSSSVNDLIGQCYLYGINGYEKNRIKAKEFLKGKSNRYIIDLSEEIPISTKTKILFLPQRDILRNGLKIKNKDLSMQKSQEAYYYLLSASEESGEASNLLGEIALGQFDLAKAQKYFKKAISQGYSEAYENIGFMYLNGYGTLPNFEKAFEYYSKTSPHNDAYYYMSRKFFYMDPISEALKIQWLYKTIQEHPTYFGAWLDLLSRDPRTGDKDYRYKFLSEACFAAKTQKSPFCKEYKALKSGQRGMFDEY